MSTKTKNQLFQRTPKFPAAGRWCRTCRTSATRTRSSAPVSAPGPGARTSASPPGGRPAASGSGAAAAGSGRTAAAPGSAVAV